MDISIKGDGVYVELFEPSHLLPKVQIRVNETLDIKIFVYNWSLPKDHIIYEQHSTLEKIFLSDLLKLVAPYKVWSWELVLQSNRRRSTVSPWKSLSLSQQKIPLL